jgi:hypothetical protein
VDDSWALNVSEPFTLSRYLQDLYLYLQMLILLLPVSFVTRCTRVYVGPSLGNVKWWESDLLQFILVVSVDSLPGTVCLFEHIPYVAAGIRRQEELRRTYSLLPLLALFCVALLAGSADSSCTVWGQLAVWNREEKEKRKWGGEE